MESVNNMITNDSNAYRELMNKAADIFSELGRSPRRDINIVSTETMYIRHANLHDDLEQLKKDVDRFFELQRSPRRYFNIGSAGTVNICHANLHDDLGQLKNDQFLHLYQSAYLKYVGNLEVSVPRDHEQVEKDEDCLSEPRRSPRRDINIESAGTVNICYANLHDDLGQLKKVHDNRLMLECHWPKDPLPSTQRKVLLTKMINKQSEQFYRKVVAKIQEAGVPEGVMRTLYKEFQLKLLGMTKGLEVLMEGSVDMVEEVMGSRSAEVQQQLAQFVPEEQRGQVEWGEFLCIPVQCREDLQRLSKA